MKDTHLPNPRSDARRVTCSLVAAALMWWAPNHATFTAGLLGVLLMPLLVSIIQAPTGRRFGMEGLVPLLAIAAAAAHGMRPDSKVLAIVSMLVVGGAFPAHLWLEALRARTPSCEFLALVLAQPGLALAVHILGPQTVMLDLGLRNDLASCFVLTAILQTGMSLVRDDPMRAVLALGLSQSALLTAGAMASEHGFTAEYLMLAGADLGLAALVLVLADLRNRYALTRIAPDNGLAETEPTLSRFFVTAGWFMIGLPGGVVFFAEDLLFHALIEHSPSNAIGMIFASVMNGVGFYRIHLGVFSGRARDGIVQAGRRPKWLAPALAVLVLATLFLGLWPQLMLGHGGQH